MSDYQTKIKPLNGLLFIVGGLAIIWFQPATNFFIVLACVILLLGVIIAFVRHTKVWISYFDRNQKQGSKIYFKELLFSKEEKILFEDIDRLTILSDSIFVKTNIKEIKIEKKDFTKDDWQSLQVEFKRIKEDFKYRD